MSLLIITGALGALAYVIVRLFRRREVLRDAGLLAPMALLTGGGGLLLAGAAAEWLWGGTRAATPALVGLVAVVVATALLARAIARRATAGRPAPLDIAPVPNDLAGHSEQESLRERFKDLRTALGQRIETLEAERGHLEAALRNRDAPEPAGPSTRHDMDDVPICAFTVDRNAILRSVNRFAATLLGYEVEELQGRPAAVIYGDEPRSFVRDQIERCLALPDTVRSAERRLVRRDGALIKIREAARCIPGPDADALVMVVGQVDGGADLASERGEVADRRDELTGLMNRREFARRLSDALEDAHIEDSEHALCYIDLDQFRVINETCGHPAGDELLRAVGGLLGTHLRRHDTLARLGGDEFAVLMEHCSLRQARRIAGNLCRALDAFRFQWGDETHRVAASIGVVPVTAATAGPQSAMAAADSACFVAKEKGRNRVHVFRRNDADLAHRQGEMRWLSRIDRALDDNRLVLFAQPIVPLAGSDGQGHFEILLRMREEDGSIVTAGSFLPALERYNLSARVDRWVFGSVLDWLGDNPRQAEKIDLCAINISGLSVGDEEFLEYVIHRLDQAEVAPEKLCFEITETAAISNLSSARRFIRVLKAWGCRFALDDFGSGLCSFAYLKTLPVDFIKIDGMFVRDIIGDPVNQTVVRAVNDIGHALGKLTVAEFVEGPEILDALARCGIDVDFAQGFGMGVPRALDEIALGDLVGPPRIPAAS